MGCNATIPDATFNTFSTLVSTKADAGTTYVPPDGVRRFRTWTPWAIELEGALRLWLSTHGSDFTAACAAIGVSTGLAEFDTTIVGDDYANGLKRVHISPAFPQARGGGTGLHSAVYRKFLTTTDYRAVQKTGSFSADLASAMAAWS